MARVEGYEEKPYLVDGQRILVQQLRDSDGSLICRRTFPQNLLNEIEAEFYTDSGLPTEVFVPCMTDQVVVKKPIPNRYVKNLFFSYDNRGRTLAETKLSIPMEDGRLSFILVNSENRVFLNVKREHGELEDTGLGVEGKGCLEVVRVSDFSIQYRRYTFEDETLNALVIGEDGCFTGYVFPESLEVSLGKNAPLNILRNRASCSWVLMRGTLRAFSSYSVLQAIDPRANGRRTISA